MVFPPAVHAVRKRWIARKLLLEEVTGTPLQCQSAMQGEWVAKYK
jgi:hypothetical protein